MMAPLGPQVCTLLFPTPPAVPLKGFVNSTSLCLPLVIKPHPSRGLWGRGSRGSHSVVLRPAAALRKLLKNADSQAPLRPGHLKVKEWGALAWVFTHSPGDQGQANIPGAQFPHPLPIPFSGKTEKEPSSKRWIAYSLRNPQV